MPDHVVRVPEALARCVAIALVLVLAPLRAGAQAPSTYAPGPRVAHLGKALATLAALGAEGRRAFELALHEGVRAQCRAGGRTPATACMIEVARAYCGARPDPAGCTAASDVVLTNQHAETDLVDAQTRMKLVRTSSDYHAAILAELWSRYELLAAELAMSPPHDRLEERIDRFCALRDDPRRDAPVEHGEGRHAKVHRCEPGAKACVPSLAWQRCAAGLVRYVAGREVKR